MKAITKAEFEAALAEFEQEVGGAGEFVGGGDVAHHLKSTSSPASLTDFRMSFMVAAARLDDALRDE